MQCRKVSLLLLLLACLAGLVGFEERNIFTTHTKLPLYQQLLRTAPRGAACGCRPEARELLLAACCTENKLLPSDSPAEHRALFASCNVSERWSWAAKWCSEWLLHRLLLASLDGALFYFFTITLSRLQEIHRFHYFHKLHLALTVWSLWIHRIKPKLFLLTTQTTNTPTAKHYF